MSAELVPAGAPISGWKAYPAYKDSSVEWQKAQGSQVIYIFQTGLTGSTGYVLYFNPVILSRIKKPQMNADERRLIASEREERKAEQHKSIYIDKIIRPGTRIKRIFTDNPIRAYPRHPCNPCSIVYNSDEEIRYLWHISSIRKQEAAQ